MTPSSTWRASRSVSVPASTSATSSRDVRRARPASPARRPGAFARRAISPVHHLRAAAGVAPAATVAVDLVEQAGVDDVLELEVGEAPVGLEPAAARGGRLGQRGAQLLDRARRDGTTGSRSGSGKYR